MDKKTRLKRHDGAGPQIRALREVPKRHRGLTLAQLQTLYTVEGAE